MRINTKEQDMELYLIAKEHGGILTSNCVIEFSRNPKTALHSEFDWDSNDKSDQRRRASKLIRCHIRYMPKELDNDEWSFEIMDMARKDLVSFVEKYKSLPLLKSTLEKIFDIEEEISDLISDHDRLRHGEGLLI